MSGGEVGRSPVVGAVVDRDVCAGTGQCLLVAPGAFRFDDEGTSTFDPHGPWTEAEVRQAADFCPMGAIILDPPED